jgi:Mrp family chromosome partitioning ATPase
MPVNAQPEAEEKSPEKENRNESGAGTLVRLKRTVLVKEQLQGSIDTERVDARFYNNFDSSMMMKLKSFGKLVIGITSPTRSDGKTLVAANLAFSLSLAKQARIVLVDMHIAHPDLHTIFGVPLAPGLLEAFTNLTVNVYTTPLKDLYVLPAGNAQDNALPAIQFGSGKPGSIQSDRSISPDQLASFRDIVYSLAQEFDFVIVDLPPVHEASWMTLFTKQLDGVIVVVSAGKSKQGEVNKIMNLLGQDLVLGFVFNGAKMSELV